MHRVLSSKDLMGTISWPSGSFVCTPSCNLCMFAVFPILADPVDVKKGDQQCETVSQPSTVRVSRGAFNQTQFNQTFTLNATV